MLKIEDLPAFTLTDMSAFPAPFAEPKIDECDGRCWVIRIRHSGMTARVRYYACRI